MLQLRTDYVKMANGNFRFTAFYSVSSCAFSVFSTLFYFFLRVYCVNFPRNSAKE